MQFFRTKGRDPQHSECRCPARATRPPKMTIPRKDMYFRESDTVRGTLEAPRKESKTGTTLRNAVRAEERAKQWLTSVTRTGLGLAV